MSQPAISHPPPIRSSRRLARIAILVLAVCCVFWGYSFPAMQMITHAWDRAAAVRAGDSTLELGLRATFLGWRFALAAAVYWLLARPSLRELRAIDCKAGLIVGGFMSAGMFLQILGLRYTLPSISAFLTALAVIFAPLAQALVLRQRVGRRIWLATAVAIGGTLLLSQSNPAASAATLASPPPLPYLGEVLTILGAIIFTAQILAVDRLAPRADVARMTLLMIATVAVINALAGAILAGGAIYQEPMLRALTGERALWWIMPTLVVFSTVLALHLMNIHQPRISPAAACVVYCLEPVFATMFSVLFHTEKLTAVTTCGGAIVLSAVLIVAAGERRDSAPA